MRKVFTIAFVAVLVAVGIGVYGQGLQPFQPTPVVISGQRYDAPNRCDSQAGSGAQTLTLQNPGPGLSDYITTVIVYGEATGTVTAAAPIAITTTNIAGTSPTLGSVNLTAWTIGATTGPGALNFGSPIKANTNTAPTVAAASVTNLSWRITACYYMAP